MGLCAAPGYGEARCPCKGASGGLNQGLGRSRCLSRIHSFAGYASESFLTVMNVYNEPNLRNAAQRTKVSEAQKADMVESVDGPLLRFANASDCCDRVLVCRHSRRVRRSGRNRFTQSAQCSHCCKLCARLNWVHSLDLLQKTPELFVFGCKFFISFFKRIAAFHTRCKQCQRLFFPVVCALDQFAKT